MAGELAIVLSGGGAKGAFQVGVLDELGIRLFQDCEAMEAGRTAVTRMWDSIEPLLT